MLAKECLFELFLSDPHSKICFKLLDYMKREDSVTAVNVPGCDPNERHLRPTDLARLSALEILKWIITLHSAGWSLNGKISPGDFFLKLGNLKMKKGKMKVLKRCKIKREKKDMKAIALLIHEAIFKGSGDIPCDFQHLIWLLRRYKRRYVDLMLNHPSVLTEGENLGLFRTLYADLQRLLVLDPEKYHRIVSQIPYCNTDQDHWKLRCQHNKYMMKILQEKTPLSSQAQPTLRTQSPVATQINSIGPGYNNSAEGLLEFLSDSCWNLVDYSVGEVKKGPKRGKKRIRFEYHQQQHMLSAAFPQVICRFQKAMHAENELASGMFNGTGLRDFLQ